MRKQYELPSWGIFGKVSSLIALTAMTLDVLIVYLFPSCFFLSCNVFSVPPVNLVIASLGLNLIGITLGIIGCVREKDRQGFAVFGLLFNLLPTFALSAFLCFIWMAISVDRN